MAEPVNIIAVDFDDLEVERIYVADADGRPELRALVSGIECRIEAKPKLLAAGLVSCLPVDPAEEENWPAYADLMVNGVQSRYYGIAQQPRLTDAARRFERLLAVDEARPGMAL